MSGDVGSALWEANKQSDGKCLKGSITASPPPSSEAALFSTLERLKIKTVALNVPRGLGGGVSCRTGPEPLPGSSVISLDAAVMSQNRKEQKDGRY